MPRLRLAAAAFALALPLAPLALAHEGEPLEPHDLWRAWSFEPGIVIPLAASAWIYRRGSRRRGIEAAAFWAGWTALAIALVSPLHPLGEVLFSAHMAQHMALMMIAAPLLVLGGPLAPFLRALPSRWRRPAAAAGRAVSRPAAATAIQGAALWIWHVPPFYQAALSSEFMHALQHLSFVTSALLFWWALLHGSRAQFGASFMYVFATAVHTGILGALLTFAPHVLYPAYGAATAAWGLTPLEDQQLGGLIMWVPGGTIYIIAGLLLFARWLGEAEKRGQTRFCGPARGSTGNEGVRPTESGQEI